jgi:hypothetical protein
MEGAVSNQTQAAGSKPAPPPPKPEPAEVTFESPSRRKRVYDEEGKTVARFGEGRLTTSDPQVVAVLDALPDVRRVED